jgi:HTH-type transcriptional regulator/antitoxin HipB
MKVNSALDLAATVRGRRQDLGLSQTNLAKLAGVSRVWISTLEGGKRSVDFGLVLRLLGALELEIDISPSKNRGADFKGAQSSPSPPSLRDVYKGASVDLDWLLKGYRD